MTFTIPNLLSLLRMGLIPLFIISILDGRLGNALLVFVTAGVTDALDGMIARFFGQQTLLGAYLDPVADKLLLTSAFVILAIPGLYPGYHIPVWVAVLVIARDVVILAVAIILYLAAGITRFQPSLLSKWNTAVQIAAVALVLASGLVPDLEPLARGSVTLVVVLTVASGLHYGRRVGKTMEKRRPPAA